MSLRVRPCHPCRAAKTACSREFPTCGACMRRKKPSPCIYEKLSSVNCGGTTIQKPKGNTQAKPNSGPHEQSFAGTIEHVTDGFEPPKAITEQSCFDVGHSTDVRNVQISKPVSPEENEDLMTSTVVALESIDEETAHQECHSSRISQPRQDTKLFSESHLQVWLPTSYTVQIPKMNYSEPTTIPRTFYQLLLILNYLFVAVMLPGDEGALHQIIRRGEADWDRAFVPQYCALSSWLTAWLTAARRVLTESIHLSTASVEDLELQIKYLLFILGQHASPPSTFLSSYCAESRPPYRPFGTKASVALICYTFMGIQAHEMNGYDRKEIWTLDEAALRTMVLRLNDSPLFPAQVTLSQVHSLIVGLQSAFQVEEIRVASTKPQILYLGQDLQISNYYRRAFSSLDPQLLPKFPFMTPRTATLADATAEGLVTALAKFFSESDSLEALEAAFDQIPEITASRPDQIVVTEMFHVKAWHHAYLRCPSESRPQIWVFYVSLPGCPS